MAGRQASRMFQPSSVSEVNKLFITTPCAAVKFVVLIGVPKTPAANDWLQVVLIQRLGLLNWPYHTRVALKQASSMTSGRDDAYGQMNTRQRQEHVSLECRAWRS